MNVMILAGADLIQAAHWPVTVTFGLYDDKYPNCASANHWASEGGRPELQRRRSCLLGRARRIRPGARRAIRRGALRRSRLVQADLR